MLLKFVSLSAQNELTLQNAIKSTLEYNYGIRLVRYETELSELQNHPGNAGMLPTISATATYNTELSNTEQLYFNGDTRSETNAGATVFEGGVYLNYTVFDGMGMYALKERLEELEAMGELKLRQEIEATVFNLMAGWYQMVQLQNAAVVMQNAVVISNERYQITKTKESLGSGSGLDALQAFVDLNEDSSALININLQIANAKAEINQMMGRDPSIDFVSRDQIMVNPGITLNEIKTYAESNNLDLLIAQKEEQIISIQIKEFKSLLYPTLTLNGGYGYLKSTSEAGFVESNLSYGPSVGLTLSIPLFNGFTVNRNLDAARVHLEMSEAVASQTQLSINTYIYTTYNQYVTSLYLMDLEQHNVEAARNNVSIAIQQFDAGTITSVDLRDIQQTQIEAENRLLLETLNAKLAELQLKKLSGTLVEN